jgi:hypothetical protein
MRAVHRFVFTASPDGWISAWKVFRAWWLTVCWEAIFVPGDLEQGRW